MEELVYSSFEHIIVIDDGSAEKGIFEKLHKETIVLTHLQNFGKVI